MTDENNQIKFFLYENWARTKTGQHTVRVPLRSTKIAQKKVSSKIIALFTLKYEFIDIFHEIGKNSEAGGRPEEHIFAFQEHNFNCVTIAKPRVGKVIDRLPSFFALIFELPAQNTLFIT